MEIILAVITVAIIAMFLIKALGMFDRTVKMNVIRIAFLLDELEQIILLQHKKTRKESQEIKTRLTQVRKDLNKIEKMI